MSNMMKTLAVRLAAIAIVTGFAASANAVYYTFDGTITGKSATVKIDGVQKGVQAVLYKLETAESGYINPLWSICTDINGKLKSGNYQIVDFAGNSGTQPQWSPAGGIENAAFLFIKNRDAAKLDPMVAAGLQLACWEALYDSQGLNDGSLDLSAGRFQVIGSAAVKAAAQTIIDQLGGQGFVKLNGKWLKPVLKDGVTLDRTRQGGIYVPDGGLTILLLGLGLGGMALVGRRSK